MNAARDLRTQADAVEKALQDRVTETDEIREKLENDLSHVRSSLHCDRDVMVVVSKEQSMLTETINF